MDRREFCRRMAILLGAAAAAPALKACAPQSQTTPTPESVAATLSPTNTKIDPTNEPKTTPTMDIENTPLPNSDPSPTATITSTQLAGTTKIALIHASDRYQGVIQALNLLNLKPLNGRSVFLKPNFNSADPAPGSTDIQVLRALIEYLRSLDAGTITVGDRSGMGDTRLVMEQKGVFDLATELGFSTVVFDELLDSDWTIHRSPDFHWSDGFAIPNKLMESEFIVQTCNLKTHRYGGHFTMALKNSVGLVARQLSNSHDYMSELHNSPYQRQMIAEINTAYKPDLIVMDGVEAFITGGPATGKKARPEIILAGDDPVAIDAAGVAFLRLHGTTPEVSRGRIFEQEQIARAVELGLGVDNPDKIQILTADEAGETKAQMIQQILVK